MGWKRCLITAGALALLPSMARAGTICDYYQNLDSGMYKSFCGGGSASRPSGAQTSLASSLSISPAALATGPTSYGLEGVYSAIKKFPAQETISYGVVKGFKRKGAGLSVSGGNTFYDNDLIRRYHSTPELETFDSYEKPRGKFVNLTLGAAVSVYEPSPGWALKLGGAIRYGKMTGTWGGGPSALIETPFLRVGTGLMHTKISSQLPYVQLISSLASIRFLFFEFEYNRLDSHDPFHLGPVHIYTGSFRYRGLILTGAVKRSEFEQFGKVRQTHFAIQYLVGNNFGISYLNNFIPGCHSLGLQLFL